MKVALLGDIHGNSDALNAVLVAAKKEGAVKTLITGDLVGYYPDAPKVLELLIDWDWTSVGGNHEGMLSDWCAGVNQNDILFRYGSAIRSTFENLTSEQVDLLVNLPSSSSLNVLGKKVLLCHGSPWDRDVYIYPDASEGIRDRFSEGEFDLVVFGHTHYPTRWVCGETLVVNPGSVGQPRDRKPGACWVLWDSGENTVEFRREEYDMGRLIAQIKKSDPQLPYLWKVLTRTT